MFVGRLLILVDIERLVLPGFWSSDLVVLSASVHSSTVLPYETECHLIGAQQL